MAKKLTCYILFAFAAAHVFGQEALPGFTITERNKKVVVSWSNPFPNMTQLNVQRSYDSLKNFSTIFSPENPALAQNGYTDNSIIYDKIYYRIFYVLTGGDYYFTRSKRAGGGAESTGESSASRDLTSSKFSNIDSADKRMVVIKIKDAIFKQLPANRFKLFRDSILRQTKDTLTAINDSLITISPYVEKEIWKASKYVYSNSDGYISIALPRVDERKYSVKFFEENSTTPLFEIPRIRESPLILEKSTFIHAGWFNFELYEDDKVKEKNKFYVPKDF